MPRTAQRVADLADKGVCASLSAEGSKYRVAHSGYPTLKLVVEPDGRKYWSVRYVISGKNTERVLGRYPAMLQPKAMTEAVKLLEKVSNSVDPAATKRADRQAALEARTKVKAQRADTFNVLADRYLAASEKGGFRGRGRQAPKAASTLAKERQHLKKHLRPRLGDRPWTEITRREIKNHLDEIAGDSAANSCLEVVRRVFAYGRDKGLIEHNPAAEIERRSTRPRDVTATDEALKNLWAALEECKADRTFKRAAAKPSEAYAAAAAIQLALLTLQRRGEVVRIRREEVDLDKGLWTIPAMNKKERRKGLVPLSDWAVEILTDAFARSGSDWAFPGAAPRKRSKAKPDHLKPKTVTRLMERLRKWEVPPTLIARVDDPATIKRRGQPTREDVAALEAARAKHARLSSLQEVTPHDLRRTGRTKLTGEELQIDEMTAERVLNHSVGSRQQNAYDWNAYLAPKRNALNAWADELRRIVHATPPPSNIHRLGTARAQA